MSESDVNITGFGFAFPLRWTSETRSCDLGYFHHSILTIGTIHRKLQPSLWIWLQMIPAAVHANKNSFVLNSLIVSLSFAAFSNSNLFAASRMSLSSFAM